MPCSAVTLSLATIAAIVSVALLAIAFSTDNWLSYEVKRNNIQVFSCSTTKATTLEKKQRKFLCMEKERQQNYTCIACRQGAQHRTYTCK